MEVVPREIAHEGEVLLQVRNKALTKQKQAYMTPIRIYLLIELPFFHFYATRFSFLC